ncbi:hypothetical protein ACK35P_05240, partial [Aeromonas veronii]
CGDGELIHHSDRGVQYCSGLYQSLHERYGVKCSMKDGYDCYQNALAERVNGILKGVLLQENALLSPVFALCISLRKFIQSVNF